MKPVKVLISSVSKKIPLIKGVRKVIDKLGNMGKIVGADSDDHCIGSYFVDHFWKMPLLEELTPDAFIAYCQFYGINCVIPTRDGELLFYAENKNLFAQQGIHVMISEAEAIEICLDKREFYQVLLGMGYPSIETATEIKLLEADEYVVKERYGAGGYRVGLALTEKEATAYAKTLDSPVFQPYIPGDEISVDLYIDHNGKVKGVVLRKRELVMHGESQITSTFQHEKIEEMCTEIAKQLGLYGHIMFQLIHRKENDVYYVLECNPRFGGASTLSLEVGLDSFYWFLIEAMGKNLDDFLFIRSKEEKKLVRYPEDLFIT